MVQALLVLALAAFVAIAACDGGTPASPIGANRNDAGDASANDCVIDRSKIGDCKL